MIPAWCATCGRLTTIGADGRIAIHRTGDTVCGASRTTAAPVGDPWGHERYIGWLRERVAALRRCPLSVSA